MRTVLTLLILLTGITGNARERAFELKDGDRVVGAAVRDIEGNGAYEIRAKRIINATGVWIDDIQDMEDAGIEVPPLALPPLPYPSFEPPNPSTSGG